MGYHAPFAVDKIIVMRVMSAISREPAAIMRRLAVLLVLLAAVATVRAEPLYEAEVPVSGQHDSERARALRTAFEQVLLKVTGRRETVGVAAVETALRRPMQYVQQFLYQPLPDNGTAEALHEAGYTEMLRVRFDANAVNQMLTDAGLPLWGRTRPVTLLWLAVEENGRRRLLGGEGGDDMQQVIEHHAHMRGIPVLLPLMDLEDRRQLHFTDVWGNFQDVLMRASARYGPGAVLAGRLLREPDGMWSGRWSLYLDGGVEHWSARSGQWEHVLAAGIDGTADLLAERFARIITPGELRSVDFIVTDVHGIEGYQRAMHYLSGLDPVNRLQVLRLDGDQVKFRLSLSGDRDSLVNVIALGSSLVPAAPRRPGGGFDEDADELIYRLLP